MARMTGVIENLVVYPEKLKRNLDQTRGLPFSQGILLRLIKKGLSRQDAYARVQTVAMKAWEDDLDFTELAENAAEFREFLSSEELAESFDLDHALRRIPDIFTRVFGGDDV